MNRFYQSSFHFVLILFLKDQRGANEPLRHATDLGGRFSHLGGLLRADQGRRWARSVQISLRGRQPKVGSVRMFVQLLREDLHRFDLGL